VKDLWDWRVLRVEVHKNAPDRTDLESTARKRLYVTFDCDNDVHLGDFIVQQSHQADSPFEVVAFSTRANGAGDGQIETVRANIKAADATLVLVGRRTHKSPRVLGEVRMARQEGIPIVQMIGFPNRYFDPVPEAGSLFTWDWDNLKMLVRYVDSKRHSEDLK
jgi:hypothetical protein